MKTKFLKTIILIIFLGVFVIPRTNAQSVSVDKGPTGDYEALIPLPGFETTSENLNLEQYLPKMFNLSVVISAILAFGMIVYGGIVYTTSNSIGGKGNGKDIIQNAIYGLLLVIGSWTILYTINPQFVNMRLLLPETNAGSTMTIVLGTPLDSNGLLEDKKIRDELWNSSNQKIQAKLPCKEGQQTNCVNLNGLPPNAIQGLINLNMACGYTFCPIFISGGTEGGHKTHEVGAPIVDLRNGNRNLDNWIRTNGGNPVQTSLGPKYTINKQGVNATFLDEGDHWHVVFQ